MLAPNVIFDEMGAHLKNRLPVFLPNVIRVDGSKLKLPVFSKKDIIGKICGSSFTHANKAPLYYYKSNQVDNNY